MNKKYIKNIEHQAVLNFGQLVEYKAGQVVSMTLSQNEAMNMTLFAFGQGEGVSTHSSPGDAMVYILDGEAEITIGDDKFTVKQNQGIVMPANIPHGLEALKEFKMLLVVIKQ